jgi:ribosomal protein S18 acetylase RimI-like enzyme
LDIRILGPHDGDVLSRVADGVFDDEVSPELSTEFLQDSRHHLAVAVEADTVVGFASAVHYVHPDKPAELWINEVGVAPSHQRQGVGQRLLEALFDLGHRLGCREAWVLTEQSNVAAKRLYESVGGSEPPEEAAVMYIFRLGFPLRPSRTSAAPEVSDPHNG